MELFDEIAPVREDQDAARLRCLDEAERRDRLAGAGGVLEPEALGGVGVLGLLRENFLVLLVLHPVARLLLVLAVVIDLTGPIPLLLVLGERRDLFLQLVLVLVLVVVVLFLILVRCGARHGAEVVVLVVLLVQLVVEVPLLELLLVLLRLLGLLGGQRGVLDGGWARGAVVEPKDRGRGQQLGRGRGSCGRAPVARRGRSRSLGLGEQRRQRAREGIDLVRGEERAVLQAGLVGGKETFEPEQHREAAAPLRGGVLGLLGQLGQREVERAAARGAGGEHDGRVLAVVQETLAHKLLRASQLGGGGNGRGHEGHWRGLGH